MAWVISNSFFIARKLSRVFKVKSTAEPILEFYLLGYVSWGYSYYYGLGSSQENRHQSKYFKRKLNVRN